MEVGEHFLNYHAIILEGGFNDEDKFISIPFAGLQKNDVQFFRGKIARQFGIIVKYKLEA